jgi:hypothetical protein
MQCYKFPDQTEFRILAAKEGLLTEENELITGGHGWSLLDIGTITRGGEWDPETGEVITPPTVLDGYHVNTTTSFAPEAWDPYLVVVNHPAYVWLGGPTQAPDTPTLEEIVYQ